MAEIIFLMFIGALFLGTLALIGYSLYEEGYLLALGFEDLEMAEYISMDDIDTLSRAERKELMRMTYSERKETLMARFPNSVPTLAFN